MCGICEKIYWKDNKLMLKIKSTGTTKEGIELAKRFEENKKIKMLIKETIDVRNEEVENIVIAGFAWLKED